MSLSDMFGKIVDFNKPAGNWLNRGIVHVLRVHMVRQEVERDDEAIEDYWATLCESHTWEEKAPRMTKKRATCVLCLGLEHAEG